MASSRIAWLHSELRRKKEEATRHTERLEALGKLAGGVAHDFNNLLTVISLNLELLKDTTDPDEQKESALVILQTMNRARGLTRQLMTFARDGEQKREEVKVANLINEGIGFLSGWENIIVRSSLPSRLPTVWADSDQLARVIQNLLLNAAQAMDYSGEINIDTHTEDGASGRHVVVSVQDQGLGVPDALMDQIFDPYFTTKDMGTGLGLATSFWIIRRHGGSLSVQNTKGSGACFKFTLPALHVKVAWSPKSKPIQLPSLYILILEDERPLANGLNRLLTVVGHTVVVTHTGSRVGPIWKNAKESGRPFDLAILDLIQPNGIGGLKALKELRAIAPESRTIVMSGYTDDNVISNYQEHGFNARLSKPFHRTELERALQTALGFESQSDD